MKTLIKTLYSSLIRHARSVVNDYTNGINSGYAPGPSSNDMFESLVCSLDSNTAVMCTNHEYHRLSYLLGVAHHNHTAKSMVTLFQVDPIKFYKDPSAATQHMRGLKFNSIIQSPTWIGLYTDHILASGFDRINYLDTFINKR